MECFTTPIAVVANTAQRHEHERRDIDQHGEAAAHDNISERQDWKESEHERERASDTIIHLFFFPHSHSCRVTLLLQLPIPMMVSVRTLSVVLGEWDQTQADELTRERSCSVVLILCCLLLALSDCE